MTATLKCVLTLFALICISGCQTSSHKAPVNSAAANREPPMIQQSLPPPTIPDYWPMHISVFFPCNGAVLTPQGQDDLDKYFVEIKRWPKVLVQVKGYTCDLGKRDYNLELSNRRANAVRDYLISKGIDASRIIVQGLGPDAPASPNTSERNRVFNRRVEVEFNPAG